MFLGVDVKIIAYNLKITILYRVYFITSTLHFMKLCKYIKQKKSHFLCPYIFKDFV